MTIKIKIIDIESDSHIVSLFNHFVFFFVFVSLNDVSLNETEFFDSKTQKKTILLKLLKKYPL